MSRRRVVVTGLGCVSPVGNTVQSSWAQILAGQSGIDTITHFDASAFACHFAGEVKNLNLDDFIPAKEARSMVMRIPLEGGGRLVVELNIEEATNLGSALQAAVALVKK
mgnify:CR=1 FL=1